MLGGAMGLWIERVVTAWILVGGKIYFGVGFTKCAQIAGFLYTVAVEVSLSIALGNWS